MKTLKDEDIVQKEAAKPDEEKQKKPSQEEQPKLPYASLEELRAMPLKEYKDYIAYNKEVLKRRKYLKKVDAEILYAPLEIVPKTKVKITRTNNKHAPIKVDRRDVVNAVKFKGPKDGYKQGDVVEMPDCIVKFMNGLAIPIYKQIKNSDGSSYMAIDHMDNQYSLQSVF